MTNIIARIVATSASKRYLRQSGLFDAEWYKRHYTDLGFSKIDSLTHYVEHGAPERRDPSPVFDTNFYLRQFESLDPAVVNPLCHYLLVGEELGAWPNDHFDPNFVRTILPPPPGRSVLAHVLSLNSPKIRTCETFDTGDYLEKHPHVEVIGVNPLWHALAKQEQILLPEDGGVQDIVDDTHLVTGCHDLAAMARMNDVVLLKVTGDDPHLEIRRRDGQLIQAGHYRLTMDFLGKIQQLSRAKCYFDFGSGYSESATSPIFFRQSSDTTVKSEISIPMTAHAIRFDPVDSIGAGDIVLGLGKLSITSIARSSYYCTVIKELSPTAYDGARVLADIAARTVIGGPSKAAARLRERRNQYLGVKAAPSAANSDYHAWIKQFDTLTDNDVALMRSKLEQFSERPKISIVMPVYNTPEELLRTCIDSVRDQIYPDWELCIADDMSTKPHVRRVLNEYMSKDSRIKVVFRIENGHISKASNSALEIATGEWIALLDHDDVLPQHALYCVADAIIRNPEARMFYSDEDKIDLNGNRMEPYFKSDWNERLFFEQNMICHLGVYQRGLVEKVGGFRTGFEGAQDHDLTLRFTETITPDQIVHIPHILYHWRVIPGSTAMGAGEKSYAVDAGCRALESALERRGIKAKMETVPELGYYRLKLPVPEPQPLVSIIIPTRDGLDVLEPCIRSLKEKTTYTNFEVIIVDNQSEKPETLEYFKSLEFDARIRVLNYDDEFNYSAINNYAVAKSKGELICLLNNDTEIISPEWLSEMVAELSQDGVGAVGAKLLYTDGTVQHAGVVLGVGGDKGVAGHGLLAIGGNDGGYFSYAMLTRETSAVTAACLLTTREIFDAVGGLNEGALGVAFNDIDLCLKIGEAGHKIIWTPYAILHHHESKSRGLENTPEKQARFMGEVDYMLNRWGDLLQHDPYYNPNLALDADTYTLSRSPRVKKPWNWFQ